MCQMLENYYSLAIQSCKNPFFLQARPLGFDFYPLFWCHKKTFVMTPITSENRDPRWPTFSSIWNNFLFLFSFHHIKHCFSSFLYSNNSILLHFSSHSFYLFLSFIAFILFVLRCHDKFIGFLLSNISLLTKFCSFNTFIFPSILFLLLHQLLSFNQIFFSPIWSTF